MRKFKAYLAILMTLGFLFLQTGSANAVYQFGWSPFDTINQKANLYAGTYGMTPRKLAAIMIAVVYNEAGTGPGTVGSPSPMALSRWDPLGKFAYNEPGDGYPYGPYPRAWFHAGVGFWQFDSVAGSVYSYHSPVTSIPVSTAADVVAQRIAGRYSGASDFEKFRNSLTDWVACWPSTPETNGCWQVYTSIYNQSTDSWTANFQYQDYTVTNLGGAAWARCWFYNYPGSQWDCLRVDPAQAQGGNKAWRDNYDVNGSSSYGPLTYRFYAYQNGGWEDRFWKKAHSGYNTDVRVFRQTGQNARTANSWYLTNEFCSNDFSACP